MAHKPPVPLDSWALEQLVGFFLRESAGELSRSVKFVKLISTAVAAYGPHLALHKSALRRALAETKTFMTKATLQKVDVRTRAMPQRESRESGRMSYRDYVELSSIDEYRKFKSLPPIRAEEIESVDLDEILRRLAQ